MTRVNEIGVPRLVMRQGSFPLNDNMWDTLYSKLEKEAQDALKQGKKEVSGEISTAAQEKLKEIVNNAGGGSVPDKKTIEQEMEKAAQRDKDGTANPMGEISIKNEFKRAFTSLKSTSPIAVGIITGLTTFFVKPSVWLSITFGFGGALLKGAIDAHFRKKGKM